MSVETLMTSRLILGRPDDLEQAPAEEVKRHNAGDPLAPLTITGHFGGAARCR